MEEKKLTEVLERMEKKQNQLLESMACVLNFLSYKVFEQEPKDANEKENKSYEMQELLNCRDKCIELIYASNIENVWIK